MRNVGIKPIASTEVRTSTAPKGSEVMYHNGRANRALTKHAQSMRVFVRSPFLMYANNATSTVSIPDTPMGHAPTPPLSASWAANAINVVMAQMVHEKT